MSKFHNYWITYHNPINNKQKTVSMSILYADPISEAFRLLGIKSDIQNIEVRISRGLRL